MADDYIDMMREFNPFQSLKGFQRFCGSSATGVNLSKELSGFNP